MLQLPEDFEKKYQKILAEESFAFFESLKDEAISAFRINPLKKQEARKEEKILNTPWGYYGKISGKSLEHVAGMIYSQEPAAQMVAQVADIQKGMAVLDVAAAPGGKSTHILSYLENTGLLVSNEISPKRSKILVENIERFGARNVIVTNESVEHLEKAFSGFFDLIIFDGPCSGEGMFRKDPDAMQYWHTDYPEKCSILQKDILKHIIPLLKKGGSLVYSTCTWSYEENEQVVKWLLEQYDHLELVNIPKINGMVEGIEVPEVARMYPHHFKGEGQFVAKFRDKRQPDRQSFRLSRDSITREQKNLWKTFERENLNTSLSGVLQTFGDHLYLLPKDLPDISSLKIARNGLHLGTFKKNRFEPSFALGLTLSKEEVRRHIDLTDDDFYVYVSGNVVTLTQDLPNGWYQVCVKNNGIGFAKVVGKTLKNYFPKGLRFHL